MSSPAYSPELGTGQQTLHNVANSHRIYEPVRGVYPRVKLPDKEYEHWLQNNRYVRYVVINFSEAFEVIQRDGDLSQVLEPWHIPIILGTEPDEVVDQRSIQNIFDLWEASRPLIHVPDVAQSYQHMDEEKQENAISAYIYHVRVLQQEILTRDWNVRLIPTNKGWTVNHFKQYRDLFDEFGYNEFAFYAVQYTGGDAGNSTRVLRRNVTNVLAALDLDSVFMIGRSSYDDLLRFDPRVQGAAGLRQWKDQCGTENGLSQEPFPTWQQRHEAALAANNDQQQSYFGNFTGAESEVQKN